MTVCHVRGRHIQNEVNWRGFTELSAARRLSHDAAVLMNSGYHRLEIRLALVVQRLRLAILLRKTLPLCRIGKDKGLVTCNHPLVAAAKALRLALVVGRLPHERPYL